MKRLIILLIIMLLLGGAAYYINQNKSEETTASTIDVSDRQFAVENLDDVGKITLQKAYQDGYLLEKKGDDWYINGKYKASTAVMPYLLRTINKISIQNIPPRTMLPNIMEEIERIGIQVKIYDKNDQLMKSYRVGTQAADDKGVAMLMDGKSQPYNVFIPGFEGEIRRRYFVENIDAWRARKVFESEPETIEEVSVEYHRKNSSSFIIDNRGEEPSISPLSQFVKIEKEVNTKTISDYIRNYRKLYAENFDNDNVRRDSISNLIPFVTVTLKEKGQDPLVVKFHSYAEMRGGNPSGEEMTQAQAVERLYADMSNGDFMLVQGRVFNKIFRPLEYFLED